MSNSNGQDSRAPDTPESYQRASLEAAVLEDERRSRLSSRERIIEDITNFCDDPAQTLVLARLEPRQRYRARNTATVRQRPRCPETAPTRYYIVIRNSSLENPRYGVPCLETVLHLPALAPTRFKLRKNREGRESTSTRWGFMIRKWFKHSGRIDLEEISVWFRDLDEYENERKKWSVRDIEWQLGPHSSCETDCGSPECRRQAPPKRPALRSFIKVRGEPCQLSTVLAHPDCGREVDV